MRKLDNEKSASAQMIGVVVAGLVSIIIGVLIWYKMNTAVFGASGIPARVSTNPAALNATRIAQTALWNTTNGTTNTVWTLFPIVAIVIVAGIVMAVVMGFGRQQT